MSSFNIFSHARINFEGRLNILSNEIKSKNSEYILNVDADTWEEFFIIKYQFQPVQIITEEAKVEFDKKILEAEGFGDYKREVYIFKITVPYTGSAKILELRPSRYNVVTTKVIVTGNKIIGAFKIKDQNAELFEKGKSTFLSTIKSNLSNANSDAESFNKKIGPKFREILQEERKRINKEKSFFKAINIEINENTDKIFKTPIIKKKVIPEPKFDKKKQKYVQTPEFEKEMYDDVLEIIYNFFKSLERKPSTYKSKDEEGLRDYVLSMIETRYVATTATGETFNKMGKTDILLKYHDGSNLFIAECKFWTGPVGFHETIDQLFDRYLTWRDSKVAIIFFSKNKGFTDVLEGIKEEAKKHPNYESENGQSQDSSFSYIFRFPDDPKKKVYTEIMAFSFNNI